MFKYKAKRQKARKGPLNVTVFVSDFHAERMDAIFQWVFGLEPSLLNNGTTTVTVSICFFFFREVLTRSATRDVTYLKLVPNYDFRQNRGRRIAVV